MDEIESTIGFKFTTEDATNFQSRVAKPFFTLLKENIQNRFSSQDIVYSFSVFYPKINAKNILMTVVPTAMKDQNPPSTLW